MKLSHQVLTLSVLSLILTSCGGSSSSKKEPKVEDKNKQEETQGQKPIEPSELVLFEVGFGVPNYIASETKRNGLLTYAIRKKGLQRKGIYRIYSCMDKDCMSPTPTEIYTLYCDENSLCKDSSGDSSMTYTFTHLWSPLFNGSSGIDFYFTDPNRIPEQGFYDNYYAADFEENGKKTERLKFHLKK
jgi:hypothetical protein